jgi:hypothetical protein
MQNLNESAKSKGVIVFAFNTDVDYVGIADQTSRLIDYNLKLPITLVTDQHSTPAFAYDQIVRIDNTGENFRYDVDNQTRTWKNFGRYLAYELSPYNETIVMDTDYLVLDDSLLKLFETEFDYKLMHHNRTPTGVSVEVMGETSLPFVWATVALFRKTERAELFFNLVGRIQRNYPYYCNLYNIRERNYRNDYAFAIANIILSGYAINEDQGIPWTMFTIEDKIESIPTMTNNFIHIRHADRAVVVPYQCIHVMDKEYLQSTDFKQVVGAICEPV